MRVGSLEAEETEVEQSAGIELRGLKFDSIVLGGLLLILSVVTLAGSTATLGGAGALPKKLRLDKVLLMVCIAVFEVSAGTVVCVVGTSAFSAAIIGAISAGAAAAPWVVMVEAGSPEAEEAEEVA
jgi:hypothetical protein